MVDTQSPATLHSSPKAPELQAPSCSPVNLTHLSSAGQCSAASVQAPTRQMWSLLGIRSTLQTAPAVPTGQVSSSAQAGKL